MNNFLTAFLAGESFLLGFLLYFHPLKQNAKANKWLSFFAFILGTAFIGNYIDDFGLSESFTFIIKWINSLQFLLAPAIYIGILYFVNPTSKFKIRYWLHFLPFIIFAVVENIVFSSEKSISTRTLFDIGETSIFIRDILLFQLSAYVFISYLALRKHNKNLELIAATTGLFTRIKLTASVQFFASPTIDISAKSANSKRNSDRASLSSSIIIAVNFIFII